MTQVYVKYNPYLLKTDISINGQEISADSILYKNTKGKRLQEWIGQFPQNLKKELNCLNFEIEFQGFALDWDDFKDAFKYACEKGEIGEVNLKFLESKSQDEVEEKIYQIFDDLQNGPVEEFKSEKLVRAFKEMGEAVFPINVIATMSSGKSTLINALLGKKLMPAKNQACTATVTEIKDNDKTVYNAVVYNENGDVINQFSDIDYDKMDELNEDPDVHRIYIEGDIPFLDSQSIALTLVDTPGPNNSQNQTHKNITYRAINNGSNNLILYVLNGTQLSTNDDASLLEYIAQQIRTGGKQVRDRFLFVINKMDAFDPENEDIDSVIEQAKKYLLKYGIEDPQIFPCSAFTALNIRTELQNIDVDNISRNEMKKLSSSARDTISMIDKLNENESMHFEKYSTLSPSAQQMIDYKLNQAIENEDTKEQAIIHSGIYSIEAAITAYVKKYAKTKKIKDLVECFSEVLEANQVMENARQSVANNEKAAKACAERAKIIREKIDNGSEAKVFKKKVKNLNPLPQIEKKATELKENANRKVVKVFKPYASEITNKDEAKRMVYQYTIMASDAIAELSAELEAVINEEVVVAGNQILRDYQKKLEEIDENSDNKNLDFSTADLVRGALASMTENASQWVSDKFTSSKVDELGEVTYEERVYHEKVGEKEEEVVIGSHKEKIGTQKVQVGSHRERVGTRRVENYDRKWFQFWKPKYYEEDVYKTIYDYEERDVFETVLDYDTIKRDIFEERREKIEKFSIKTSEIQKELSNIFRANINHGTKNAFNYADEQIRNIKKQFMLFFDELDNMIKQKYNELEKISNDETMKKQELEKSKKILSWIEHSRLEMQNILDV